MTRLSTLYVALALATLLWAPAGALADKLPDHRPVRGDKGIAEAWFEDPTTRYQHYVLGSRYEAGSLAVRSHDGRVVKLTLPDDSVFEDREPRLADLDGDGRDEIIVVRSYLDRGAALAVVALKDGALKIIAETPPTGRANTWLNPAGIADFDGDGTLDIAYVQMPHVLGLLRVWTMRQGKLVELATLPDISNHRIGSPQLKLSAVADINNDGVADLIAPSKDRQSLRVITFKGGVKEIARHPLPSAVDGDFRLIRKKNKVAVEVGLAGGKRHIVPLR